MGNPIDETAKDEPATSSNSESQPQAQPQSQSQPPQESQTQSQPSTSATAETQQTPTTPSELPPAALDLAAKLFDYARTGSPLLADYVSAGVPKNLTNHAGDTLLMLAAYHDQPETVKMLLEQGADPNICNGRGQSPLAGAVFKGYVEVVRVLLEGGAHKEAGQPTAGECAVMFKRVEIGRLLGIEIEA